MIERFTYVKPRIAFAKDGFTDNTTGETYDFEVDTVLDLMNELNKENIALSDLNNQELQAYADKVMNILDARIKAANDEYDRVCRLGGGTSTILSDLDLLHELKKELKL